jgi:hypothetical protein
LSISQNQSTSLKTSQDAGTIPNSRLPVLIYPSARGALDLPKDDPASAIEALIRMNDWGKELLKGLR